MSSLAPPQETVVGELSYVLSAEEVHPLIKIGKGDSQKVINGFGLWVLVVSLLTGPIWMAAMSVVEFVLDHNEQLDPHRASFDKTGKIWAHLWLTLTDSTPTYSGELQLLQETDMPCLYVANHASWLDIPVLCTVLDPVFKFIAKGELKNVPCVGQQLAGVRLLYSVCVCVSCLSWYCFPFSFSLCRAIIY
jgi:1-acyl-sn-glycerol-3-phosphate acyltransferase